MTDNTQLAMLARSRRKKAHAHWWVTRGRFDEFGRPVDVEECDICQVTRAAYELRQRRGRSSLRAGKDAERSIAKAYVGQRVGQYGGQADVIVGELFVVQSKAGGWFSPRYWNELAKLPRNGGRIPTLIVSERPGRGGVKARRMVIRMLEDDVALHGEKA